MEFERITDGYRTKIRLGSNTNNAEVLEFPPVRSTSGRASNLVKIVSSAALLATTLAGDTVNTNIAEVFPEPTPIILEQNDIKKPELPRPEKKSTAPPISVDELVTKIVLRAEERGIKSENVFAYFRVPLKSYIGLVSSILGLDYHTSVALAYQESKGNINAKSTDNARGLFQITKHGLKNLMHILYDEGYKSKKEKNQNFNEIFKGLFKEKEEAYVKSIFERYRKAVDKQKARKIKDIQLEKDIRYFNTLIKEKVVNRIWERTQNNPHLSSDVGMSIFAYLMQEFKDNSPELNEKHALNAYNAGEGVVKAYLKRDGIFNRFKETRNHYRKTQYFKKRFEQIEKIAAEVGIEHGFTLDDIRKITYASDESSNKLKGLGLEVITEDKVLSNMSSQTYLEGNVAFKYHIIQKGESLYNISRKYDGYFSNIYNIMEFNGLDSKHLDKNGKVRKGVIRPGQLLKIPLYDQREMQRQLKHAA